MLSPPLLVVSKRKCLLYLTKAEQQLRSASGSTQSEGEDSQPVTTNEIAAGDRPCWVDSCRNATFSSGVDSQKLAGRLSRAL